MANDHSKTRRDRPWLGWLTVGCLFVLVSGLLATYVLRPGNSGAENARTAEAISDMDEAQNEADTRREKQRSATALLN